MATERCKCRECSWRGSRIELLTAPHQFDPEDTVHGCPQCLCVDSYEYVCEADGCWQFPSIGQTHPDGVYRFTCTKHQNWAPKEWKR